MKGTCQSNGHLEQGSDSLGSRDKEQGETKEGPTGRNGAMGVGGPSAPDFWFGNPGSVPPFFSFPNVAF